MGIGGVKMIKGMVRYMDLDVVVIESRVVIDYGDI